MPVGKAARNVFLCVRRIVSCEESAMNEPRNRVVQIRRFGGPDELGHTRDLDLRVGSQIARVVLGLLAEITSSVAIVR